MTALTSFEVESYFERVRTALADLAEDVRDELLEELPDHLAEVAADEDGSLVDRLGEPEAYAAELRAAAGYEPVSSAPGSQGRLAADLGRRIDALLRRVDEHGARWAGYDRLTDLVRALQPGWWLVRGWLLAQLVSGTHDRASWHGFVPVVGQSKVLGLALLVLAIVASFWLGRRSIDWSRGPRRVVAVAGIVLAIWGADLLLQVGGGAEYVYTSYDPNPQPIVQDLYVYDQNGNLVPNARLYDQNGNPVQLGSTYCPDGSVSPDESVNPDGTGTQAWTYPICPSAPGPFQAGPGAVAGLPSASVPAGATPTPAPTAPRSAQTPATPKPTPTR